MEPRDPAASPHSRQHTIHTSSINQHCRVDSDAKSHVMSTVATTHNFASESILTISRPNILTPEKTVGLKAEVRVR
eukprot:COSAG02_NODE_1840_length_10706_cov_224.093240_3_plen_76_part_00